MTTLLDLTQERHVHINQRLRDEKIAWLISGRPDGRPHAVPIGFLWDGEFVWIFTRPGTQKLRNISHNAQVLLALDNTHAGIDPISLEGTATLLVTESEHMPLAAYAEKYANRLKLLGLTPEGLAAQYSQAICITPSRVVGLNPTARKA